MLAILLASRTVVAAGNDVESLIREGISLRREGNDQDALERFRKAYALAATPRALAQIALAEQALGLWNDAAVHVRTALQSVADPWIAKNRAVLEEAVQTIENHLGKLDIRGTPAGTEVHVEGRVVGVLPLTHPIELPVGNTTVHLSAPGRSPITRTVTITTDHLARETIALQPASSDI
ncbi:MAG TPA: PEGA domain-containing protein [Polyangia bacterium]|nr:PEGA domain-containing protein [Polyangia bacterium]